eukprot:967863-Pelagomonas_calceolata.AAC.3
MPVPVHADKAALAGRLHRHDIKQPTAQVRTSSNPQHRCAHQATRSTGIHVKQPTAQVYTSSNPLHRRAHQEQV